MLPEFTHIRGGAGPRPAGPGDRLGLSPQLQQHKDEDLSSLAQVSERGARTSGGGQAPAAGPSRREEPGPGPPPPCVPCWRQDEDLLFWHKHGDGWKTPVPMEEDPLLDTDMLMSEFSDTLFSTLSSHQPVSWPNPREIAHLGNADMIQPGLMPLQPNLDFMDTFEPFPGEDRAGRAGRLSPSLCSLSWWELLQGVKDTWHVELKVSMLSFRPLLFQPLHFWLHAARTCLGAHARPQQPACSGRGPGASRTQACTACCACRRTHHRAQRHSAAGTGRTPAGRAGPQRGPSSSDLGLARAPRRAAAPLASGCKESVLTSTALPTVSLPDSLIGGPAGPTPDPASGQGCERAPRPGDPFVQPVDFSPPAPPLGAPQPFLPVFAMPLLGPGPAPTSPALPLVAPPAPALNPLSPASFLQPQTLAAGSKSPSVITHAAAATFTHAAAATFSQGQGVLPAARQPSPAGAPRGLALAPAARPPTGGPPQPRLTFVHPKPVSLSGGRPKQPPKIVPAPKPEPVSLVLKNACLSPAALPGQPPAVIVTPGPLKGEGVLASAGPPSSVVIAPAAVARAPGVAEFHGGILVAGLGRSAGSQPGPVPRLFSPGAVQDGSVKGEQVPAAAPSRDGPSSGQASPCASEQSPSPQSPQNSCSGKSADPKNAAALKNRQLKHISAEQKRRFNIKMGFDTLNSLISNSSKLTSHATTLQKAVEHITKLQQERSQMQEEGRRLREEIEELNATIISCQQLLPATGAPVARRQVDHMRDMFDEYVKSRTLQNWKFWIFSIIIKPLFESFRGTVSTGSLEELHRTALAWLEQHCALPVLRPTALSALRHLSTSTSILTDPAQLPRQAAEAVASVGKRSGES
ncbi:MLX-interacting protein [Galemys pyrenaicus]|uniref:MLX-interacting protein n=1 Tax=Galemys pyrenaicus TaxID=202257 RepID=A0A8J6DP84_GALPY|nr:MLX-interacting protein [Galemys pyrenaicus]